MIARILQGLLLLQLLALAGLCYAAIKVGHVARPEVALLLALAVVLLVRGVIAGHNFWLSRRFGSPTPPCFQPDLGMRCRLFAGEFAATMLMSSWMMAWPRLSRPAAAPAPRPDGLPVLLLHGYVCNRGYWTQLSALLAQAGIAFDAPDLEPIGAGIDDFVPQVDRALAALCARAGSSQAIIVAHSMGGLVARAYLRAHGEARIARVITLGTPYDGTALARYGPGRNAQQMSRGADGASDWLRALAAQETPQRRAMFTSIFSHHDNIVMPQTSSRFADAKNLEFGAIGHVALARHPVILQTVLDEIALAAQGASSPHARSIASRV